MSLAAPALRLFVWGALTAGLLGCAFGEFRPDDPMGREITLGDAHKHYTDSVRWSKFDEASGYIEPAERDAFLAQMPEPDLGRFTDWEGKPWSFDDPEIRMKAVIEVTYRAYSMANPVEFKVKERQSWSRADRANDWVVKSEFTGLDQFGGN